MVRWPRKAEFQDFIEVLQEGDYTVGKYLPRIDDNWYEVIASCVGYVAETSHYDEEATFMDICARLLYKIAKRHELGDGNKRSSVIALYLFCLINDYYIIDPAVIKQLAKRVASTKGRMNEALMRKRLVSVLEQTIEKAPEDLD